MNKTDSEQATSIALFSVLFVRFYMRSSPSLKLAEEEVSCRLCLRDFAIIWILCRILAA
jgi:hypothetical protein